MSLSVSGYSPQNLLYQLLRQEAAGQTATGASGPTADPAGPSSSSSGSSSDDSRPSATVSSDVAAFLATLLTGGAGGPGQGGGGSQPPAGPPPAPSAGASTSSADGNSSPASSDTIANDLSRLFPDLKTALRSYAGDSADGAQSGFPPPPPPSTLGQAFATF
jgi:hypothetical protein